MLSLNNEPCLARPILNGLDLNERVYYSLMISLDRCNGSCNTLDDLSSRICFPNKTEDIIYI